MGFKPSTTLTSGRAESAIATSVSNLNSSSKVLNSAIALVLAETNASKRFPDFNHS